LAKSFTDIKPKQVAARLINTKYPKATNFVIASFDYSKSVYIAIIDLGDPVRFIFLMNIIRIKFKLTKENMT